MCIGWLCRAMKNREGYQWCLQVIRSQLRVSWLSVIFICCQLSLWICVKWLYCEHSVMAPFSLFVLHPPRTLPVPSSFPTLQAAQTSSTGKSYSLGSSWPSLELLCLLLSCSSVPSLPSFPYTFSTQASSIPLFHKHLQDARCSAK